MSQNPPKFNRAAAQAALAALRVTDPATYTPPDRDDLSEEQRQARAAFDLDEAIAALPPYSGEAVPTNSTGSAGTRLRAYLQADIADDLLREVARDVLGAQRCSRGYLPALRVVLGNQAHAERHGYVLEMNRRGDFASPQTMRTIIDQMKKARIGFPESVNLGGVKQQTVWCFSEPRATCSKAAAPAELERMYREHESESMADPSRFIGDVALPY